MTRLKDLEKETERLRKAVSDLTLEKLILRGELGCATGPSACANASGNFFSIRGSWVNSAF